MRSSVIDEFTPSIHGPYHNIFYLFLQHFWFTEFRCTRPIRIDQALRLVIYALLSDIRVATGRTAEGPASANLNTDTVVASTTWWIAPVRT